jgi:hypothetical protein
MQTATVKYQIATYSGEIQVTCDPDDDNEVVIGKAKAKLRRLYGELPFRYQSFMIVKREEA